MGLNKNDTVILNIESLANTGAGVAHHEGQVVFVNGALPGEKVEGQIIKATKSYCVARIKNILTQSEQRCQPKCKHFPRCGGCVLQHLEYSAQLENKRREAEQVLCRISGINFNVEKCIGMDHPWSYRNKAQLPVGVDKNGNTVIGFYSQRSHDIIDTNFCDIQAMDIEPYVQAVKRLLKQTKTQVYDEVKHKGSLRHLMLRKSHKNCDIMVVLVVNQPLKCPEQWRDAMLALGASSVWINVNNQKGNIILSDKCTLLGGAETITDSLCGVDFELSPLSFLQVNPVQAEKLYLTAVEMADISKNDTVLDAYCGIGIMTQLFARACKKAWGVEIIPDAIQNAKQSAKNNGINNADFIVGDCARELPKLIDQIGKVDCLVLDPPRAGCDGDLLKAIGNSNINKIVYVSCDVATLARDCAILAPFGFAPSRTVCVDMFPQTKHVETVCLLSKLNAKQHIEINLDMDELDLTDAEKKATYQEIKDYVLEHSGLKVSSLYIAQVKQKCGIIERENYNKPKSEDAKQPQCPPDKEKAIKEALQHFGMI